MQHQQRGRTFGRKKGVRKAFIASLVEALIREEKILTTEARAKELRSIVEKMVTKARTDSVANRRLILAKLAGRKASVKKLFETIAPRYKDRKGGYTRITKVVKKSSDGRRSAVIEFI